MVVHLWLFSMSTQTKDISPENPGTQLESDPPAMEVNDKIPIDFN